METELKSTTPMVPTDDQKNLFDTRYDKSFAYNIELSFKYLSDEDARIVRALIAYLSNWYQTDLFGNGIFDVQDFADKCGFSEGKLRKTHPNPWQFRNKNDEEIEKLKNAENEEKKELINGEKCAYIFDSYIANALYYLHTNPIILNVKNGAFVGDKTNEEAWVEYVSRSVILIPELRVYRKANKLVFGVKLDQRFTSNLRHYYTNVSNQVISQLKSSNLDVLYVKLCNLKSDLRVQHKDRSDGERPSFETLCNWAGISRYTCSGGKYEPRYRKRDLKKAINKIKEHLKFEDEWKGYKVVFYFEGNDSLLLTNDECLSKERLWGECVLRSFVERYRAFAMCGPTDALNNEKFYQWFYSADDSGNKHVAFEHAYMEYKKDTNLPSAHSIDMMFNCFCQEIAHGIEIKDLTIPEKYFRN